VKWKKNCSSHTHQIGLLHLYCDPQKSPVSLAPEIPLFLGSTPPGEILSRRVFG